MLAQNGRTLGCGRFPLSGILQQRTRRGFRHEAERCLPQTHRPYPSLRWRRPAQFCGMHLFNPVYLVSLVEVIRGRDTGRRVM
jgi:hypothetical protein